ncbi:MAG: nucleotidyltransferase family protein [Parvibaculum sp.]|nr:nucleotidyltransferase family protein [Parvibaculum sp.]
MNETRFIELARANEVNREILTRLPSLGLADAWLVSGSLFQAVWNALTGREPGYGIKDYDIFYFDADTSWEAEDTAIRRGADLFADLDVEIELKNQARVHIWYERKFGMPYPSLRNACEGIDRFLAPACMVGIAPGGSVYAPRGFADIESMTIRPNRTPNFSAERYAEKAARWQEKWPELTVVAP